MNEFKIIKPRYEGMPKIYSHETERLERIAELAGELIVKWGMVAGAPDGEDSSGRAKLKLLAPDEVVERACNTAELYFEEIRNRGWTKQAPTIAEMEAMFAEEV